MKKKKQRHPNTESPTDVDKEHLSNVGRSVDSSFSIGQFQISATQNADEMIGASNPLPMEVRSSHVHDAQKNDTGDTLPATYSAGKSRLDLLVTFSSFLYFV